MCVCVCIVCVCVCTPASVCACVSVSMEVPQGTTTWSLSSQGTLACVWLASTNQQYLCPMSPPLSHEPGSHPLHSMPQRKKLEIWHINKFIVKKQNKTM